MRRVALPVLAVLASFCFAATAQAVQLVDPSGHPVGGVYQRWANASKAPMPAGRVTLQIGATFDEPGQDVLVPARGAEAATDTGNRWIWLSPTCYDLGAAECHEDLLHELGHIFSYSYLPDYRQREFERLVGAEDNWGDYSDIADHSPANEVFAEAYQDFALYGQGAFTGNQGRDGLVSNWGYNPLQEDALHRAVCRLIDHIGRLHGLYVPDDHAKAHRAHRGHRLGRIRGVEHTA